MKQFNHYKCIKKHYPKESPYCDGNNEPFVEPNFLIC